MSLSTIVDKARGNVNGAIVERFIKPRALDIYGHTAYYLDGPVPSIAVSVLCENFYNSDFRIWIGGKRFSDGCCITISMHEVWRDIRLRQKILKHMSILRHEAAMKRERVVSG